MQVIALAHEVRMLFNVENYVQIAGRATELPHFAGSPEADACSIFDAGRNFCVDRALAQNASFALALRAGIGDDAAGSLAGGAGAGDAEESLLIPDLAASVARAARG